VARKASRERSPDSSPLRKMRRPVSVCVQRRAKEGRGGTGTCRGKPADGRWPQGGGRHGGPGGHQWSGGIAALAGAGGLERFGLVRETGVVVGLTGGG
jgi:hypothetical protein